MERSCLQPGFRVFHRWIDLSHRPPGISTQVLAQHGMHLAGTLLTVDTKEPFNGSSIPFWRVKIGDAITHWREDMIETLE